MNLINLAEEIGLNPTKVSNTEGGEYHSPCPSCGGKDRFIIQPNKEQKNCAGFYFCRKCEISGDTIQFCRDYSKVSNFKEAVEYVGAKIPEKILRLPRLKTYTAPIQTLNEPTDLWKQQASILVSNAHNKLLSEKSILEKLHKRGLPLIAIQNYQLGWLSEDTTHAGFTWGLEKEKLWLPAGIVIPIFKEDKTIIRLKIRRKDWHIQDTYPKYMITSGSMAGLNIIGNRKSPIMIVVESELDMYALHHTVYDFACIISVGGSTKDPDALIDFLAKKKSLLICHDQDDAGLTMLKKWKERYPHAQACPTPYGKDIGEAIELGLDLRSWIISQIPEEIQYELKLIKSPWNKEDQPLIDWILDYIDRERANSDFYQKIKNEIELGPNSSQAQTRELQEKLSLMKELAEKEYKRREKLLKES